MYRFKYNHVKRKKYIGIEGTFDENSDISSTCSRYHHLDITTMDIINQN